MFSSESSEWGTPPNVAMPMLERFRFTRDVCAKRSNALVPRYWSRRDDALAQRWGRNPRSRLWMNPPYGRGSRIWIEKAATAGCLVVCLLPSRTDTVAWHKWVMHSEEILFVRRRITFLVPRNGRYYMAPAPAPFPSAIVVFNSFTWEGRAAPRRRPLVRSWTIGGGE